MPPKEYSAKKQIERLAEDLAVATKVADNRGDQLDALEKTIKEKGLIIEDRCRAIGQLAADNESMVQILYKRNEQYNKVCEQNIALRKALKEVP